MLTLLGVKNQNNFGENELIGEISLINILQLINEDIQQSFKLVHPSNKYQFQDDTSYIKSVSAERSRKSTRI